MCTHATWPYHTCEQVLPGIVSPGFGARARQPVEPCGGAIMPSRACVARQNWAEGHKSAGREGSAAPFPPAASVMVARVLVAPR
eukprot:NODE_28677_length_470_cov_0.711370.p2 GENE.NODE_28677_length_470_cov_0.711370~~NODE_28677_length_470_cov_0.711370.p2  ORF type:complete len:84 (-),score=4.67 NODE_28677_length_470_cov_0.711370:94-345(-)